MIGFQQGLVDIPRPEEPPETSGLSKNQLYDRVVAMYFLPPFLSRGVTREYLLGVLNNEYFRVTHNEIKHFEVDLTKQQTAKATCLNNALVVKKMNLLLRDQGRRPLGFTEYEVPESAWLFRIARFVDQTNLMELFQREIRPEPPVAGNSRPIQRTHHGRTYASRFFFQHPAVRTNKKIWDSLRYIGEAYRTLQSAIISEDVLRHELQEIQGRIVLMNTQLNDLIGKCAFTYAAVVDPTIRPELIIQGGEAYTNQMRETVNMAQRL